MRPADECRRHSALQKTDSNTPAAAVYQTVEPRMLKGMDDSVAGSCSASQEFPEQIRQTTGGGWPTAAVERAVGP